ncbi:outer membrane protein [Hyphomicrobium sp. 99]|uniref:outer membrane protein n=1 Tax=Hyphomicrobium sp. 99 TaxID=1163419 RepID=UPI0005F79F2D|nr:outer membrane beta-barrel protein [Hyphomicrobium sp. 99]
MVKVFGIAAVAVIFSAGTAVADPGEFNGFYVGGIASAVFDSPSATLFDDQVGGDPPLHSGTRDRPTYGVKGGYNFQIDRYVLGVEGDWSWGVGKTETAIPDDGGPGIDSASARLESIGSVRGRLGYAFFDNAMVFGTAGIGWGNAEYTFRDADEISGRARFHSDDMGAVYGGGFELLFAYNLVLTAEYLHYDFSKDTFIADAPALNGGSDIATRLGPIDTLRVSLSYKFGGGESYYQEEPLPLK